MHQRATAEHGAGRDGHLLLLSRSEGERRHALASWVRRGIERGERVVYTQRDDDPAGRSLTAVLADDGLDVSALSSSGQLQVLSLEEYFPPGGHLELVHRALDDGFPALRLSAEARSAVAFLDVAEYARVEQSLEHLCDRYPVSALCQYPPSDTPSEVMSNGFRTHLRVREPMLAADPQDDGVVLSGEVDLQNAAVLEAVLARATEGATDLFWVDLSAIAFLDVAACRAILSGTRAFRSEGGDVLLQGPSPMLARTLRRVGLESERGISVVEARP